MQLQITNNINIIIEIILMPFIQGQRKNAVANTSYRVGLPWIEQLLTMTERKLNICSEEIMKLYNKYSANLSIKIILMRSLPVSCFRFQG